jgi:pimeloyl-ACP methyl ester carboxylesterase
VGWATVVLALARKFRVLTYDRRGHSQSETSLAFSTVYDDVADLVGLVEALGLAPAHPDLFIANLTTFVRQAESGSAGAN